MKTIKVYIGYNDYTRTHYHTKFEILEELPKLGSDGYGFAVDKNIIEVLPVKLDVEQGSNEVYDYDYYEVVYRYLDYEYEDDNDDEHAFICVKKEE